MSFIKCSTGTLYYNLFGPKGAPLIVFTHGAGMDHRMFTAQVEALRDEYRVLVWDIPGHGNSGPLKEEFSFINASVDLIALLNEVRAESAVLVGHSLGGYISQMAASLYPNRVLALVMIGSTPLHWQLSGVNKLSLRFATTLLSIVPEGMLWRLCSRQTALNPQVQRYAEDGLTRVGKRQFICIWRGVTAVTTAGIPAAPNKPLLITCGAQDYMGNIRKDALRWHRSVLGSHYAEIPNAGHNANQDNPEPFNAELSSFLQEVAPTRSRAFIRFAGE